MRKYCIDCEYCSSSFGAAGNEEMRCIYFSKDILSKYGGDVHDAAGSEIACEQYYSRQFPNGYDESLN